MYSSRYGKTAEVLLAVPLLFGRNVSCPDLRQKLEEEKDLCPGERQMLNSSDFNDSSTDVADLDLDQSVDEGKSSFHLRPPDFRTDLGSMESLLMDDDICPSPTPLKDRCKSSSELSVRKLGNENSLLRTSLRRRRDSNPNPMSSIPPDIFISDHSNGSLRREQSSTSLAYSGPPSIEMSPPGSEERGIEVEVSSRPAMRQGVSATEVDHGPSHTSNTQAKLMWKLSKLAKRWYDQLKEDFSEIRPFEIEDKPLFEVEEFSIKSTTDALNRFDDLFAAIVDGPLRDSYNEMLRLTQWTNPMQTLLTLVVLLHSLWTDYLITLIFIALCVSLIRNYMIAQGWVIEKDRMDVEARRRPNAIRVTNLFQLNLRVMKTFQILTDLMDKLLALWTWKRPEITGALLGALLATAIVSVFAPIDLLMKLGGTMLIIKAFILDYIFFRFPRVRAKYDLLYNWFNELPTGKDLERQRKFHKSLKISKSTNDLTSMNSTFDASTLRKLEQKLAVLFDLNESESLVSGWELGKRCTLINKDRSLTSAFKSGRLFLTEKHILFMRYKTQSPKNISIALENILRVEKGKHSGWLPGDAQTLDIVTDTGTTLSFGALADRDDVYREILLNAAQHAYKRKLRERQAT